MFILYLLQLLSELAVQVTRPAVDTATFVGAGHVALFTTTSIIAQIFIQYTLPLRSILWSMWYKELNGGKLYLNNEDKPKAKKKRSVKRPSEKLMEETNKKYSTKKLDKNILRRVMEKQDND